MRFRLLQHFRQVPRTSKRSQKARLAFLAIFPVLLASPTVRAQTFQVLYAFKGGNDGEWPNGGLARDAAGNLYGATTSGGGSLTCNGGCGTIFRLDPKGKETVLYRFSGGADGSYPF